MRITRRLHRSIQLGILGLAMFLIATNPVPGQSGPSGTLTGIVQDQNGANVRGVTVSAQNLATGQARTTTTGEDGQWTLPGLPVGEYEVAYEMAGFKKLVRNKVEVEASVPRTLEDKLEIGEVGAVINVTAGADLVTPETSTVARQLSA